MFTGICSHQELVMTLAPQSFTPLVSAASSFQVKTKEELHIKWGILTLWSVMNV